jgi:hypothetical protein
MQTFGRAYGILMNFRFRPSLYAIFALSAIACLLVLWQTANPVIEADAWWYLSSIVEPYLQSNFEWSRLYLLRGPGDHAQPLQRLILLMNVEFFAMDFRIDAVIGYFFLLLCTALLTTEYLRLTEGQHKSWYLLITAVAVIFCCLSFNNIKAYQWPLVMKGYSSTAAMMLYVLWMQTIVISKKHTEIPKILATLAFTFILLVLADDTGIIALGVTGFLALCFSVQEKCLSRIWPLLTALILGLLLYIWFKGQFEVYIMKVGLVAKPIDGVLGFYLDNPQTLIDAILIPLGSSLTAKSSNIATLFPYTAKSMVYLVGVLMLALNLLAWWVIFRYRLLAKSWLPAALMLISYAFTLAILIYRVPAFGSDYLHATRYVKGYQLALWGNLLIVFWYGAQILKHRVNSCWLTASLLIPACGLILVQLAHFTKTVDAIDNRQAQFSEDYERIVSFHAAGNSKDIPCEVNRKECSMPPWLRDRRIAILARYELNVFSPRLKANFSK